MTPPIPLDEDGRYQLGVISGKLDLILAHQAVQASQNDSRFLRIETRQNEQDDAIAGLQKDRAWLLGGAATVGAGLSGLATWLGVR